MALAKRLYLDFADRFSTAWTIEIWQEGFVGEPASYQGGQSPVSIRWNGSDYKRVIGSEMIVTIVSPYDLTWLNTTSDRSILVQLKKGGSLYHQGFIVPNQFVESLNAGVRSFELSVNDGLGLLGEHKYADEDGHPYDGSETLIKIIAKALANTGLEMNIVCCDNLYESSMNQTDSDDPLAQSTIDQFIFADENYDPATAYDVIDKVLKHKNLRIFQSNGAWWIMPRTSMDVETLDFRVFDSDGSYLSEDTLSLQIATNKTTFVNLKGSVIETNPSVRDITIINKVAPKRNLFKNGHFPENEFTSANTLHHFYISPTSTFQRLIYRNQIGLRADASGSILDRNRYLRTYYTETLGTSTYILKFIGGHWLTPSNPMFLRLEHDNGSGTMRYYNGFEWGTSVAEIDVNLTLLPRIESLENLETLEITILPSPENGKMRLTVYDPIEGLLESSRLYLKEITLSESMAENFANEYIATYGIDPGNSAGITYSIELNDHSGEALSRYYGIIGLSSPPTNYAWAKKGEPGVSKTLVGWLLERASENVSPTLRYNGQIYGLANYTNAIKLTQYEDKIFIFGDVEYNVKHSLWSGDAYEVAGMMLSSSGEREDRDVDFTITGGGGSLKLPPNVTTYDVRDITQNYAKFSGLTSTEAGRTISERGFIYCLDSEGRDPDYSLDTVLDAGDGEGEFTASTNYPTVLLVENTAYRVRAYAINEFGIGYGNTKNFTTLERATPTVQTVRVYNILTDAVTIDGLVTSNGGWFLTQHGFCYKKATTGDPTTSDTKVSLGIGTYVTNFSSTIGSLDPGVYRIRAYAEYLYGGTYYQVYGETMAFSLAEGDQLLAVSTDTGISVYGRTATASGSAISGDTISESGLLIRVASQGIPTTALYSAKYTNSSGGNGAFSYTFTGLTASTNYYVRAYAMIDSVPYYGDYRLFKSGAAIPPTVTTRVTSWVGGDKAYAGGNITAGDAVITARGVCWIQSTTGSPTTANDKTTDGTGAGVYDSTLSVLTAGLTYRYRAYAVTADGTTYGTTLTFNTMTFYPPNVVSRFVEDIGPFSAKMSGFAISENTITARGFLLKQASSGDPTLSDTVIASDSGQGYFEEVIDGLAGETDYRIRAYATDGVGTGYGETRGFTTRSELPIVSDAEIYSITGDGFWISASITDEGGGEIEACGVCYYTGSYVAPADIEDYVVLSNGVSQEFSVYVRGYIFPSTSVQFRVFAQNAYGIGYGSNQNQTTTAGYRAVVTTGGIVIQQTSAMVGGNVIDEGDQTVVGKGICWLAGPSHPMVGDNPVSGGSGLGAYYCQMTGLTANTTYTVCAYATDTMGFTSYGQAKTFTTLQEEVG